MDGCTRKRKSRSFHHKELSAYVLLCTLACTLAPSAHINVGEVKYRRRESFEISNRTSVFSIDPETEQLEYLVQCDKQGATRRTHSSRKYSICIII